MPLVILEGFAAGLPCVSTDVGSCRELIEGGRKTPRIDKEALWGKGLGILVVVENLANWFQARFGARIGGYY